jgi:hypothetical protein
VGGASQTDGASCDHGDSATGGDACVNGSCVGCPAECTPRLVALDAVVARASIVRSQTPITPVVLDNAEQTLCASVAAAIAESTLRPCDTSPP